MVDLNGLVKQLLWPVRLLTAYYYAMFAINVCGLTVFYLNG